MPKITNVIPKLDKDGNIILKQKNCATCKLRTSCDLIYDKLKENKVSNQYAQELVSMYYICNDYQAMFIKYPIVVNGISSDCSFDYHNDQKNIGKFCIVSVNAISYDEDVHIGLFLGELPISIISLYDNKNQEVKNKFMLNPAIYVYKFNKIFYGMNMRWKFIESQDDINVIHEDDDKNYIELAKKNI